MISYFWNSEPHLNFLSFFVEIAGAIIELVLGIWIVSTFHKEWSEELKKRIEFRVEISFLIAAFACLIVVFCNRRLATLQDERLSIQISSMDPLNQSVGDISAIVDIKVKEASPLETPNWGMPSVASLMLCESNFISGQTNDAKAFMGACRLPMLEADKFDRYFDGKTLEYVLHFHLDGISTVFMTNSNTINGLLSQTRYADIITKFIPPEAEVLGGSVLLTVNSGPQKRFTILPQKDSDPNAGKWGIWL